MNNPILSALIGAVFGGIVAGIGWGITHMLSSRREEIARKDSAAREFLERQIQDLYGPLLGLIQQSRLVFEVAERKLPTDNEGKIDFSRFSEHDSTVWQFFIERYFLPLNTNIRDLIRSKMHLLDGGFLPETFEHFFIHEAQFDAFHRLWNERGVDSSQIQGIGWPKKFEKDVKKTLDDLRDLHQNFLRRIGAGDSLKKPVNHVFQRDR